MGASVWGQGLAIHLRCQPCAAQGTERTYQIKATRLRIYGMVVTTSKTWIAGHTHTSLRIAYPESRLLPMAERRWAAMAACLGETGEREATAAVNEFDFGTGACHSFDLASRRVVSASFNVPGVPGINNGVPLLERERRAHDSGERKESLSGSAEVSSRSLGSVEVSPVRPAQRTQSDQLLGSYGALLLCTTPSQGECRCKRYLPRSPADELNRSWRHVSSCPAIPTVLPLACTHAHTHNNNVTSWPPALFHGPQQR